MHVLSLLDLIMPSVALAQGIGRWGNFFNQEAYGRVIAEGFPPYFPLAVKIDECSQSCCADLPSNLGNIHYATFFYESCWCIVIFLVLWFILRKRVKHRGDILLSYLIMYGTERAFVEGLRTDSLWWGNFRVSQVLSAALVVISLLFIVIRSVLEKKKGRILMPVEEVYYGKKPDEKEPESGAWHDAEAADDAAAADEAGVEEMREEHDGIDAEETLPRDEPTASNDADAKE